MTREQTTYLKQRLAVVREDKPRKWHIKDMPKPEFVKKAESDIAKAQRLIKSWDEKEEDRKNAILKRVGDAHDRCMRLILTGDFKAAIAAIDAFEATKF